MRTKASVIHSLQINWFVECFGVRFADRSLPQNDSIQTWDSKEAGQPQRGGGEAIPRKMMKGGVEGPEGLFWWFASWQGVYFPLHCLKATTANSGLFVRGQAVRFWCKVSPSERRRAPVTNLWPLFSRGLGLGTGSHFPWPSSPSSNGRFHFFLKAEWKMKMKISFSFSTLKLVFLIHFHFFLQLSLQNFIFFKGGFFHSFSFSIFSWKFHFQWKWKKGSHCPLLALP